MAKAATATATASRKVHASLNVADLARSVVFYSELFGIAPAKERHDYAKFELAEPPLVLSLIPGRPATGGNLNHIGLRLAHTKELVQLQCRLEAAGIRTIREDNVECCYAKQTKFWVTDPDQALWEIYVFLEDSDERGAGPPAARDQERSFAKDVAQAQVSWRHQLGEPVPARIPHDDNRVHHALLEGTANLKPKAARLGPLLAEVLRVLRPGGEVRLHGLAADRPLPTGARIALPGPAAAVQHVPATAALVEVLRRAGFVDVRCERLSAKSHFAVAGIELREILLAGRKPGHRPRAETHAAVYLGPLAEVADDFGHSFPRGQRVPLNIHDWQALKDGGAAAQFLLLGPEPKKAK